MFYVTKNMKNKVKIVLDKFMVCLSQRSTNKHYKRIMKLHQLKTNMLNAKKNGLKDGLNLVLKLHLYNSGCLVII